MFLGTPRHSHGLYYVDRAVEFVHDMSGGNVSLDDEAFSSEELTVLAHVLRAAMQTVNRRLRDESAYVKDTHGDLFLPYPSIAPFGLYYVTTDNGLMVSAVDQKLLPLSPLEVAVLQSLLHEAARLVQEEQDQRDASE